MIDPPQGAKSPEMMICSGLLCKEAATAVRRARQSAKLARFRPDGE